VRGEAASSAKLLKYWGETTCDDRKTWLRGAFFKGVGAGWGGGMRERGALAARNREGAGQRGRSEGVGALNFAARKRHLPLGREHQ
jgi:hypothetical protein